MTLNQPSSQPQQAAQLSERAALLGEEVDQAIHQVLEVAARGENPEQAIQAALKLLSDQAVDIPANLSAETCRDYNRQALISRAPLAREIGIALNTLLACKRAPSFASQE